jgi:hypothetical protein
MKTFRIGAVVLLASLGLAPAFAGPPADRKTADRTQELSGITWHRDVAAALRAAQKSRPGKPVLLLRVLGDLDGGC